MTLKSDPRGSATHGYAEIEFLVVNKSGQTSHEVRITYPKSSYSYGGDHLKGVSRSVTVEPGKTVRLSIAYPERIDLRGNGAGVTIDGSEQDSVLSVTSGSSGSRGYSRGGSGSPMLVLFSKTVDTRFPDWVNQTQAVQGTSRTVNAVRADQEAAQWSANWLGYTRYDGVVVTADDLRAMPVESRNAIGQYVECGGSLFILGRDPQLPGPWKLKADPMRGVSLATPGFGQCIVTSQTNLDDDPAPTLAPVIESWNTTALPWQRARTTSEANRVFPVVDDVGVPVKGLLALMLVFSVVIGPVNLMVLARKKRKLWLFWTVPAISFATCLFVLGYMAITEGWQGRSRVEGFTVLDENTRRASTLGWTGVYTPVLPRGGLHFGAETEVSYQNGDDGYSYSRRGSGSALTIDWTRDQHLASGWMTPRVPAHFVLRKSELRRERMTITKGADGSVEAANGLGADLSQFWYLDEGGNMFRADAIPAGGRATLTPTIRPPLTNVAGEKTLRSVYAGDWSSLPEKMKFDGPAMLAPRTYFGLMDSAPFVDDGLPGASVRKTRSAVYGILKEGGDGS